MQLSFQDKEFFFHEMGQLTRSGIPFQTALGHLSEGRGRTKAVAERMFRMAGTSGRAVSYFTDFTPLDQALVAAGEENGRLADIFDQLSEYYATLAKARRQVIRGAIYPLIVLHLAVILLAIPVAITDGGLEKFAGGVCITLGSFYALVFALFLAAKAILSTLETSVATDRIFRRIPLIGGLWRNALLARFCTVLSLSLRSASGFFSGITRAADASQSAWLKEVVKQSVPEIQSGKGVARALRPSGVIPDDLDRAIEVGEQTGRLDSEMSRWAEIYRAKLLEGINALGMYIPRILYGGVAVYTAWNIIRTYMGVLASYQNILNN